MGLAKGGDGEKQTESIAGHGNLQERIGENCVKPLL
jgi:hypothetical protein